MIKCVVRKAVRDNKQIIRYLFFGICTTLLNTICYGILYGCMKAGNVASTIIAWFVAVLFAFITNKIFVFESSKLRFSKQLIETLSFFVCRIMTGILDVAIMVITVDLLNWNSVFWKLISNMIATIINYILSKFVIFNSMRKE